MKLNDWAKKAGVKYLTAYRWFKNGTLPVPAYQTDSGTIIVQDNSEVSEQNMSGNIYGDAMSVFLKKTVEFSKNNSSIEDFAAYVISNFQLKLNGSVDNPRYSKNKPKSEDIQKHFQQFLPDKGKEEQLKAIKSLIKEQNKGTLGPTPLDIVINEPSPSPLNFCREPILEVNDYGEVFTELAHIVEGPVNTSVDLDSTPQQINYTGSTNLAFNNNSTAYDTTKSGTCVNTMLPMTLGSAPDTRGFTGNVGSLGFERSSIFYGAQQPSFQPTQKELQSVAKVIETVDTDQPRSRRGRKPFKKV